MPFLPYDEARATTLTERLQRTMYRSPQDFVNFYNDEMINRKHETAQKTLDDLLRTYRDLRLVGGRIIFVSTDELLFDEIMSSLKVWEVAVKLKREVTELLEDGSLQNGEEVTFSVTDAGYVLHEVANEETDEIELERASGVKLFRRQDDVLTVHEKLGIGVTDDEERVTFRVEDLTGLDTSFIQKVHNDIPR